MSSLPNESSPYGDNTMNHNGFAPIQINPNMRTHESQMVRSTLATPNHNNHAGLSSLPPALSPFYHGPPVSASSSRFNNSRVAPFHQMRSNMVSPVGMPSLQPRFSSNNNSRFSPVLTTQTVPYRFHASASTNMVRNQNVREHGDRVMNSNQRVDYASLIQEEIEEPSHQNLNPFSLPPTNRQEHVSKEGRPMKKIRTETEFLEAINDYIDNQEEERSEDDEGIHTCLKCKCLFDTSQILAAHTRLVHGKDKSKEKRKKRLSGKNKKRYRKQNHQEIHSKSLQIKPDEKVAEKAEAID